MRRMLVAVIAIFAMAYSTAGIAQSADENGQGRTGFLVRHVKGSLPGGGTFTGNILIDRIVPEGLNSQQVRVVGTISGMVVTANNQVQKISKEWFSTPATLTGATATSAQSAAAATCSILNLTLGPIDLNVLGLMLTTNEIVIDLTAIQGGGLLGNLLCDLDNLLTSGSLLSLDQLIGRLNNLLGGILATL